MNKFGNEQSTVIMSNGMVPFYRPWYISKMWHDIIVQRERYGTIGHPDVLVLFSGFQNIADFHKFLPMVKKQIGGKPVLHMWPIALKQTSVDKGYLLHGNNEMLTIISCVKSLSYVWFSQIRPKKKVFDWRNPHFIEKYLGSRMSPKLNKLGVFCKQEGKGAQK